MQIFVASVVRGAALRILLMKRTAEIAALAAQGVFVMLTVTA